MTERVSEKYLNVFVKPEIQEYKEERIVINGKTYAVKFPVEKEIFSITKTKSQKDTRGRNKFLEYVTEEEKRKAYNEHKKPRFSV
jgi:hypothetical protein